MEKEYNVNFVTNFAKNLVRPVRVWKEMKDEYIEIQRDFEKLYNDSVEKLNELWNQLHPHEDGEETTDVEALEYGCYMHDSLSVLALIVAMNRPDDDYLFPVVFYGKEGPQFGCRVRQKPDLLIYHVAKTVNEN